IYHCTIFSADCLLPCGNSISTSSLGRRTVEVRGTHMATSEFWQRVSASVSSTPEWTEGAGRGGTRSSRGPARVWMVLDGLTIFGASVLATLYKLRTG